MAKTKPVETPRYRKEVSNMLATFRDYFPYADVEVMTGSEILQKRNRVLDNDYYNNVDFFSQELELETTYIYAYESWDVSALSGQYIEKCIEVYKD